MHHSVLNCRLFADIPEEEIDSLLLCCKASERSYQKNDFIFYQKDKPEYLHLLLEGEVAVCRDSPSGRRSLVASFNRGGDLFGEVYAFLDRQEYDYYAVAVTAAKVLWIPRTFLYRNCNNQCSFHTNLTLNMLNILAGKAYFLNQKLQYLSGETIRHKIAAFLLKHNKGDNKVVLPMNREEMADFLGVTRPSLSREFMKMKQEGIIDIKGNCVTIIREEELEDLFG
ncbi:Crp/Fnr family transcriptional regulator [Anaerocolumna xylanovorans]|uniref:cAMP-binding domain of CRP or a regulatory subunit of cAMP-dependent protein kinases n=1 Tax=Anaerocolumna xylanovorans DSM 12503 TaxID=1121345 RepID=A0A1M7Y1Y0_9FIRM|nr:Crp/Fnr family transcriptional regulator [Anaerocolumna xylanovorans]SHO45837.1 cAMP-binding domain of CRP or a regulatory subunit of cAMP-dependent protein kinases [Anaerocolumna xylanovorans DSM 12503]